MADTPKIIKLPRNGPKPGQSTAAWLAGKDRAEQQALERDRWKQLRQQKGGQ